MYELVFFKNIDHTTLFYFFSTIARSYAAITALLFTAGLSRISWLDNDITTKKKSILYCFTGTSHLTVNRVDHQMCRYLASEVAQQGIDKDINDSKELGISLNIRLKQMKELRNSIMHVVAIGLMTTTLGFFGILITNSSLLNRELFNIIMYLMLFLIIISLLITAIFIKLSLYVSQAKH